MPDTPSPRPLNRTKSMQIYLNADPVVQKIIKDCLKEERQVMNMIRRDDINVKLVNIIKAHTKTK
jgi:hypothetical protein